MMITWTLILGFLVIVCVVRLVIEWHWHRLSRLLEREWRDR